MGSEQLAKPLVRPEPVRLVPVRLLLAELLRPEDHLRQAVRPLPEVHPHPEGHLRPADLPLVRLRPVLPMRQPVLRSPPAPERLLHQEVRPWSNQGAPLDQTGPAYCRSVPTRPPFEVGAKTTEAGNTPRFSSLNCAITMLGV